MHISGDAGPAPDVPQQVGWPRLVIASLVLAAAGATWPNFVWFRPVEIGLILTALTFALWLLAVVATLRRHGIRHAWLLLTVPCVLYWPAMYAFMVGCLRSNSCP